MYIQLNKYNGYFPRSFVLLLVSHDFEHSHDMNNRPRAYQKRVVFQPVHA